MGMAHNMMMKTYLHFTPGDTLIFASVVPTSPGAVFGSVSRIGGCARMQGGCSGGLTAHLTSAYYHVDPKAHSASSSPSPADADLTAAATTAPPAPAPPRFVLSHELARGGVEGLQTTLHYLLMLVVMTFNAAYIISVILGVVVGEVAFGRLGRA
ncbi:Ctr copper transporter [Mycena rebaudengoi]|nr:Ctr copper transporter [Mycena rebaudengoi]